VSKRILIVEDEPELAKMIKYLMEQEGLNADIEFNGESALRAIQLESPDMIILDIMLPQMNGYDLYRLMRRFTSIPVLMLSAKMHDEDIIHGLEMGADDYMTKPFNNKELVLRVKKILSRTSGVSDGVAVSSELVIGDIKIDFIAKQVLLKQVPISLTPIEYKLIAYMGLNEGGTLSWERLLKEVWGHDDWKGGDKLVKVNIGRLRKKLEDGLGENQYLVTVRGMGYRLVKPVEC
jgi:DNA-binding response OmpR family regulator